MQLLLVIGVIGGVGAVLGGIFGWIRGTQSMSRRSYDPLQEALPAGRSQQHEFRRRVRQRILSTLFYAVLGAVGMLVAVALFARFR